MWEGNQKDSASRRCSNKTTKRFIRRVRVVVANMEAQHTNETDVMREGRDDLSPATLSDAKGARRRP